ncbi:MAG TPA: hypothetical protein VGH28_12280 [Polyangiaceae bacterium]|jgi:serine/threonine protein kinase
MQTIASRDTRTAVAGRYRIGAFLGAGGMAEVFEAEHVTSGGKLRSRSFGRARFLREARLVGRIVHPNVCGLVDYGISTTAAVSRDGTPAR